MKKILLVAAAVLLVAGTATADPRFGDLPTKVGQKLFDLNPAGQYDTIPAWGGTPSQPNPVVGGPCGVFAGGEWVKFDDNVNSPTAPWHWETELYNPSGYTQEFNAQWTGGGVDVTYALTLNPGASFWIDIVFDETPELQNGYMWKVTSTWGSPLGIDASVVEGYASDARGIFVDVKDGTYEETTGPGDLRIEFPEPATFGLVAFGGLLVLFRRRKK